MKKYTQYCSFFSLIESFESFKIMGAIKEQLETNKMEEKTVLPQDIGTDYTFKRKIVWFNAIGFLILHLLAVYGIYRAFYSHILTSLWAIVLIVVSGEAVTLGAHRMYTHKAFKAVFLVRLAVVALHTLAGQNCLYIWVRDHRQHHKYSDTDADPHNANRGFFFSHIGWLMSKKHPAVISKGKTIDLSDLEEDWLVMFQKEHYKFLYTVFAFGIPVAVPIYGWNETFLNSVFVCYFARYILMLNGTWLINSATHLYGTKPYDKFMNPVENWLVSMIALGEGWHNYHHAFPYDYRAAEYGLKYSITTLVIDILAFSGFVYDLKEANPEAVKHRVLKKGDGSHPVFSTLSHKNSEDLNLLEGSEEITNNNTNNEIRDRHVTASG